MNWREYIVSDPAVLAGKPTIKGTRLSVEFILSLLAGGWTQPELFESYPRLSPESLQAIFAWMHEWMQEEALMPGAKQASR
jgi:uncharacterized protein (DUF433 family)